MDEVFTSLTTASLDDESSHPLVLFELSAIPSSISGGVSDDTPTSISSHEPHGSSGMLASDGIGDSSSPLAHFYGSEASPITVGTRENATAP